MLSEREPLAAPFPFKLRQSRARKREYAEVALDFTHRRKISRILLIKIYAALEKGLQKNLLRRTGHRTHVSADLGKQRISRPFIRL
jgi:hypothetical protein